MKNRVHALVALLAFAVAPWLAGCEAITFKPKGTSPLVPLELSNDAAEFEILFVRFPVGDPELNKTLWSDVDEQAVPAALRAELAANGLRAGLIGGHTPQVLATKLAAAEDNSTPTTAAARLEAEPAVRRSRMQIHRGQPGNIVASGVYDRVPLLVREEGQLHGDDYRNAQGEFVVEADPQADHRVKISLVPHWQFGEARQQIVGDNGMFQIQSGKRKKTFGKLKFEATLAPDQMLLVTSLPDRKGSLGDYLFTDHVGGHVDQKLLVIRLADTKCTDLFVEVNDAAERK
jgi:hypothetical protein